MVSVGWIMVTFLLIYAFAVLLYMCFKLVYGKRTHRDKRKLLKCLLGFHSYDPIGLRFNQNHAGCVVE